MKEFDTYSTRFLQYLYTVEQKSENTRLSYTNELKKYQRYLTKFEIDLKDINNTIIADYLIYLSDQEYHSINHALSAIRNFHNYLNRFYPDILTLTVQIKGKKSGKHLPIFLSEKQIVKLIDGCDNIIDSTIITVLYATGMRVSEIINLKVNNINIEAKYLRCIGKRNKERIIPLHNDAIRVINNYLIARAGHNYNNSPLFLINNKGKSISRQYIYNMIKNQAIKIGINQHISPHAIRHTFATHLLDNGADLRVIQELLGHTDIKTTQIYTHVLAQQKRKTYDNFHPASNRDDEF
ncbi:MAG: tyrosine-type recombinase/integrase [Erysipelotrichaceae bacterium]